MKAFLDTHAVVLLFGGEFDSFGAASQSLIERSALFVSPIVKLELQFLLEISRVIRGPEEILGALHTEIGLVNSTESLDDVVASSLRQTWTRDPFDRMIVATAELHRAPLVTRDRRIHDNYPEAVW